MSIPDRFLGLISAVAYGLQRAKIGFIRLRAAALLLCLLTAAYAGYCGWRSGFTPAHLTTLLLCCALAALLVWVGRHGYIVFHQISHPANELAQSLRAEEKIFLRGSGNFQVNNLTSYLVEVPVVFWTTQLADHILAAKVRALNFLGIGVPGHERGWWYVFIEPRTVTEIQTGRLCFGLRRRPAVRVVYQGQKGREAVYLSCDNDQLFARLVKELREKSAASRPNDPVR